MHLIRVVLAVYDVTVQLVSPARHRSAMLSEIRPPNLLRSTQKQAHVWRSATPNATWHVQQLCGGMVRWGWALGGWETYAVLLIAAEEAEAIGPLRDRAC